MNREESRTFFGVAKNLLVRLVERGLNMPDAGRAESRPRAESKTSALPTVTLAEIYLAQGHRERALETLRAVRVRAPADEQARSLYDRLQTGEVHVPAPKLKPESADDVVGAPQVAPQPDAEKMGAECHAVKNIDHRTAVRWSLGAVEIPLHAKPALQVVMIAAKWSGPETRHEIVSVGRSGDYEIVADAQTIVRVALGFVTADDAFVPVAHSPELERGADGSLFAWTQRGREPVAACLA